MTFTSWREVADRLFPALSSGTSLPAITLIRRDNSTDSIGNTNETVVCIRQLKQVNGIALRVVTCSGIIPHAVAGNNEENTFLAFCEIMRKASLLGDIEAASAPGHIFTQFICGNELPASILSVLSIYLVGQKEKGIYPLWGNDKIKNIADSENYLSPEWKAYAGELIKSRK